MKEMEQKEQKESNTARPHPRGPHARGLGGGRGSSATAVLPAALHQEE